MLSIRAITSAHDASQYFARDNYYTAEESDEKSEWFGQGTDFLHVTGAVKAEDFERLLNGLLPQGQVLGVMKENVRCHRPGYDLTFSAPKSVSLCGTLGEDARLMEAHQRAVKKTLIHLEHDLSCYRQTRQHETRIVQSGNLVCALFHHDVSRAWDPQYHTHAIVLNITFTPEGVARALASQSPLQVKAHGRWGFSERLYSQKKYYGALYRSYLAREVTQLGYRVVKTASDVRFEIQGVESHVIAHFSKRRQAIEALLKTTLYPEGRQAETIALLTRPKKVMMDKATWRLQLDAEIKALASDLPNVVEVAKERAVNETPRFKKALQTRINRAVDFAIEHHFSREAVCTEADIVLTALGETLGLGDVSQIFHALTQKTQEKVLMALPRCQEGQRYYTTPYHVALEKDIIAMMKTAENTVPRYWASVGGEHFFSDTTRLTLGQQRAVIAILTTTDRFIAIQGYAGTGKTTSLKVVHDVLRILGVRVEGAAVSAAAAIALERGSGMTSQTVTAFLRDKDEALAEQAANAHGFFHALTLGKWRQAAFVSPPLWVIDEASLLGTAECHRIATLATLLNAKVVLLGDVKQLGAIDAGKPFANAQITGIKTVVLDEIIRQEAHTVMKKAVLASLQGAIANALEVLGENVVTVADDTARLQRVAGHFLSLAPTVQDNTLVLTPTNRARGILNEAIRRGLQHQGVVSQADSVTRVLLPKPLSRAQKANVGSYTPGDWVCFRGALPVPWLVKGRYYCVVAVCHDTETVTLQHDTAPVITWRLNRERLKRADVIQVYHAQERALAVGDRLRWTENDKKTGRINAERATVVAMGELQKSKALFSRDVDTSSKQPVSVLLANGKTVTFDFALALNQHWDYAYASSVYAAQGQTADVVIAEDSALGGRISNQKGFYVTLSRARHAAYLYLDDKPQYIAHLMDRLGDKTSALERLGWLKSADHTPEKNVKTRENQQREEIQKTQEKQESQESQENQKIQQIPEACVRSAHEVAPKSMTPSSSLSTLASSQEAVLPPFSALSSLSPRMGALFYDLTDLQARLNRDVNTVANALLGEPNPALSKPGYALRFGKKGSVVVHLATHRRGLWYDFERGEGGNLLQLIMRTQGLTFSQAVEKAAALTHQRGQTTPVALSRAFLKQGGDFDRMLADEARETAHAIAYAKRVWQQGVLLHNTLAARYLREHRGVVVPEDTDAFRFLLACWHPVEKKHYPALLVKSTLNGELNAIQRIYLDAVTGNKIALTPNKMTLGRLRYGASVLIQRGKGTLACIAEGIETALSVANAAPEATVLSSLSLGQLKNVQLPNTLKTLILCADNDQGMEAAFTALTPALQVYCQTVEDVRLAIPPLPETDFNDLHRRSGIAAVKDVLQHAKRVVFTQEGSAGGNAISTPPKEAKNVWVIQHTGDALHSQPAQDVLEPLLFRAAMKGALQKGTSTLLKNRAVEIERHPRVELERE